MKTITYFKIICLTVIFSCTADDSKRHLNELGSKIANFSVTGWEKTHERITNKDIEYRFVKDTLDRKERIHFLYYIEKDAYEIIDYRIDYINNGFKYFIVMDYDTLLHYKIDQKTKGQEYLSGKYYADFKAGILNRAQSNYFLDHFDSLVRIKGDSLPALPPSGASL